MSRLGTTAVTTLLALAALGGSAAASAPPGPRQPIEHIAISGAQFKVRSGTPGCFTGSGSLGFGFPVPRGAMVIGATAYVDDGSPTVGIAVELSRHDFTSGATHILDTGLSTTTGTVELTVDPGYVLQAGEGTNLVITIGSGTCFKGAEVHYIEHPDPTASGTRIGEVPATGVAPDGAPDSAKG